MNRDFMKLITLYTGGIVVIFYLIWSVLDLAFPEANLNMLKALSTAFGIDMPEGVLEKNETPTVMAVIMLVCLLSLALIMLHAFFEALVTTHLIRPRIRLATSTRGVLSTKWNAQTPHILLRLCNFHRADLADVRLHVSLTVERVSPDGEVFVSYLPVEHFTPRKVLCLKKRMPWTIAIPADTVLSNSMLQNYHFCPGTPIETDNKSVKRSLEILIQGLDLASYSTFVIHRKIAIDEQEAQKYTLHLHQGSFKSLPLRIDSPNDLEQYI